jgi:hypothetical protein
VTANPAGRESAATGNRTPNEPRSVPYSGQRVSPAPRRLPRIVRETEKPATATPNTRMNVTVRSTVSVPNATATGRAARTRTAAINSWVASAIRRVCQP